MVEVELPEEVELRILALDRSLWESIFESEFGCAAAAVVMENLWCPSPDHAPIDEWFWWCTRLQCPHPHEDHSDYDEASAENLPDENDEDPGWLHDYVLSLTASPPSSSSSSPRHEEGGVNGSRASKRPRLTSSSSSGVVDEVPWAKVFKDHYILRHRWLHGCDPRPRRDAPENGEAVEGEGKGDAEQWPDPSRIVRVVVTGTRSSGKSSILRALLAHDQQDQVNEARPVNVIVVEVWGVRVVLLEVKRAHGWQGKLFNGASVDGVMFVVDAEDFAPFVGRAMLEVTDEAFGRLEAIYKLFHGVAGEAHAAALAAVVCVNRIDRALATVGARGERGVQPPDLIEVVERKLRLGMLQHCSWYSGARVSAMATSVGAVSDGGLCRAAVEAFVRNWTSVLHRELCGWTNDEWDTSWIERTFELQALAEAEAEAERAGAMAETLLLE
ncbi:uncharacterized protein ACA1_038450 [Acanthamoeba castellanii str. Neff]|uniref:Uncharacterized protein n=1 Tax=Acanthamoeba castellanii (strain ATCC 30010 / Neff) TaxID=1257118 RepID=L8GKS3_ACACF|nr:uncharacterized protein ACA1_038450 [Acanthamoeba castellanii str. Neff]ELR13660.1 hypothetical protein ACA1_038450 [Acanthamoeba castellanii str. Neff]